MQIESFANNRLTDEAYWSIKQGEIDLNLPVNNPTKIWLDNNFDFSMINNCFEIGCYPGRYLAIFAQKGIEVSGIDFIPETKLLYGILKSKGFKVGEIICADFIKININKKFDCVISIGFIEHFTNWEEILIKQISLVDTNGYLIVTCPNYKGIFQRIPRFLFDRENFSRHNLAAMDLTKWIEVLKKNKFEIINSDYFPGYYVWFKKKYQNLFIRKIRNLLIICISLIIRFYAKNNHKSFSPAIGLIAKRSEI